MKNMKKKVVIVATMVLLLAAVLVMSMSTFAKYTTSATVPSTNATAAKWGFVVSANANNMWGKQYGAATDGISTVVASNGVNVVTTGSNNVVAPGTSGSVTFGVVGTAEVAAKVKFTATGADLTLKQGDTEVYKPLKWTLKKGATVVNSLENTTLAAVVSYLNGVDATVAANTSVNDEYTLTWTWAFNGDDANDTLLGQLAGGAVDGYSKVDVSFSLAIAVEQVQTAAQPDLT